MVEKEIQSTESELINVAMQLAHSIKAIVGGNEMWTGSAVVSCRMSELANRMETVKNILTTFDDLCNEYSDELAADLQANTNGFNDYSRPTDGDLLFMVRNRVDDTPFLAGADVIVDYARRVLDKYAEQTLINRAASTLQDSKDVSN